VQKTTLGLMIASLTMSIGTDGFADQAEENLKSALTVEWMAAHCDHSKIPGFTIAFAMMVLNGADQDSAQRLRIEVKERAAKKGGAEKFCEELLSRLPPQ